MKTNQPRAGQAQTQRPELTFDGCGINGPDEYRTRLFTAPQHLRDSSAVRTYGPMCAAAPELLAAARDLETWAEQLGGWDAPCWANLRAAIAKAEGHL